MLIVRLAILEDSEEIASVHFHSFIKAGEGSFNESFLKTLSLEDFEQRWKKRFGDNLFFTFVAVKTIKSLDWQQ